MIHIRFYILLRVFLLFATLAALERAASAEEYDGYTEQYESIDVATTETGTVKSILVREGSAVQEGQILAKLDDELHLVMLSIAEEAMRSQSDMKSAAAELDLRQRRFEQLKTLQEKGHARQEEVERARADVAIAEAGVLAAEEELVVKRLEHKKIQVQVGRRTILAPMDGMVTKIHKKKGEYVGPSDPYLLEMVKLNPLLAKFSLPSQRARQLQADQKVKLYLEAARQTLEGTIEFIGPVTDAQSATVQIKVRIENQDGNYYSGERCTIQLPDKGRAPRTD